MKTYISILRGINVSGHRSIKMEALRQLFGGLGFANTQTYIQSGNIVFWAKSIDHKILEEKIANAIKVKFGHDVPVFVIELKELKEIIALNPFVKDKKKDLSCLHVSFLSDRPKSEYFEEISQLKDMDNEVQLINKAIYLYCPHGYSKSKLTNSFLETKLKVSATTRNWKTTNELLNIANKFMEM